jgi:uncharacterized protein (UPF0333 family)
MNNRGNVTIFYGLMLALVIIILALALASPVLESTEGARNASSGDTIGMDCSNESISNFDKAACIVTDLSLFYFIGTLIFIGGAVFLAKIIFS